MEQQKIPIPRGQRWKEFRVKGIPVLTFLLTTAIVVQLWGDRVSRGNMPGVVVGAAVEIRSPASGYLTQVTVDRFEEVAAGEVIGQVVTTDPRLLEARLAVVLSEVELLRRGIGIPADHQRALLDYDALEMDLIRQRITLASAELRHQQAQREVQRLEELRARGLVPEAEYERARSERDVLASEIAQQQDMIADMRIRLEALGRNDQSAESSIAAAIRQQEQQLRLIEAEARPMELVAPIAGTVTRVFRSNGERVSAEEPVLVLRSPRADYIVGYLPQPLRLQPEVGMPVTIRSNARANQEFDGVVVNVGAQVEDMAEVELLLPTPPVNRTGLPVKVALGEDWPGLKPGEMVQLTLRSRR